MNAIGSLRRQVIVELWNDPLRSFNNICKCLEMTPGKVVALAKKLKLRRRKKHLLDRILVKW